ncbi:hypothetical protein [Streptomyces antibioticus]|uniref:hypothetical protein n=1 Tax=Streptomyces antibioticus TaxID=1890 RepID=UPI0033A9D98C
MAAVEGRAGGGTDRGRDGFRRAGHGRGAFRRSRLLRLLLAGLVTAAVVVPLTAAVRPRIPAPAPATLGPLTAGTLEEAYTANRANAALAARMAEAHGDRHRAASDRMLASPSRKSAY